MKTNDIKTCLIFLLMASGIVFGQNSIDEFLNEIAQNNPELKALKIETERNKTNAKTGIFPENPEIEYRMSKNNEAEFGITQSFQFPTVYFNSVRTAKLIARQQDAVYQAGKTKILLKAKKSVIQYNWLQNRLILARQRVRDSEQLLKAMETKLANGEGTQLEVDRAGRHLFAQQVEVTRNKGIFQKIAIELKKMNGDVQPEIPDIAYSQADQKYCFDSLKIELMNKDKNIKLAKINIDLANVQIKLAKNKWLPSFQAGIHTEGNDFDGPHFGLSLPVWENKNIVKEAKLNQQFQKKSLQNTMLNQISELQANFNTLQLIQKQMARAKSFKQMDKSGQLLKKALDSGELNIIDYLQELEDIYASQDLVNELYFELQTVYADMTHFRL